MKKVFARFPTGWFLVGLLIVAGSASAVIVDSNPAPFRGQENTTLQAWDFLTNANPSSPATGWINPWGNPSVEMTTGYPTVTPFWLSQDHGHQGVWVVDRSLNSDMIVSVPGDSTKNRQIWLQVVYSSQNAIAPLVYVYSDANPGSSLNLTRLERSQLDAYYWTAVYQGIVPASGKIWIRLRDCQVYIDSLRVETQATTTPVDTQTGQPLPLVDLNPAPFRGDANATYQGWTFPTSANPAWPDSLSNPFGRSRADLVGDFTKNTIWFNEFEGRQGIWLSDRDYESNMKLEIPNSPESGPSTDIWLQVVYASENNMYPMINAIPNGDLTRYVPMNLVKKQAIDNTWSYALYSLSFRPSFKSCSIQVRPRDCTVYFDSFLAETLTPGVVSQNLPPVVQGLPPMPNFVLNPATSGNLDLSLQIQSPEFGQTTTVTVDDLNNAQSKGLSIQSVPGNEASLHLGWTPDCSAAGVYTLRITAQDDFNPPGVTAVSLSITVGSDCKVVITPDIDGDGSVEIDDLILLAEQWTRSDCSASPENKWCSDADLNQDGAVNLDDLATLAALWLTDTP